MHIIKGRVTTILKSKIKMSVTFHGEKPTHQLLMDVPSKPLS